MRMNRDFEYTGFNQPDDRPSGKTKEEQACGRVLLAIGSVGLAILGVYALMAALSVAVHAV